LANPDGHSRRRQCARHTPPQLQHYSTTVRE